MILCLIWKDLLAVFFDESHAMSIGLSPLRLKILFFTLLSACTVAALQTVGAILVIAMVVTPGATAYLLTDRFGRLLIIAIAIGAITSAFGAYLSFIWMGQPVALLSPYKHWYSCRLSSLPPNTDYWQPDTAHG